MKGLPLLIPSSFILLFSAILLIICPMVFSSMSSPDCFLTFSISANPFFDLLSFELLTPNIVDIRTSKRGCTSLISFCAFLIYFDIYIYIFRILESRLVDCWKQDLDCPFPSNFLKFKLLLYSNLIN